MMSKMIPSKNVDDIFSSKITYPDKQVGLQATMVAIRKKSSDERDWRWYSDF